MNPIDLITRSRLGGFRHSGQGASFRRSNLAPFRSRRTRIGEELANYPGFGARADRLVGATRGERYYLDAISSRADDVVERKYGQDPALGDAAENYQADIRNRAETLYDGLDDGESDVTFTDEEAGVITGSPKPKKKSSKKHKKSKAAQSIDDQGGSALVDKTAGASPVAEKVSFLGLSVSRHLVPSFLQSRGAQLLLLLAVGGGATFFFMRRRRAKGGGRSLSGATASNPAPLEHSRDRDVARAAKFRREFHWGNPARRVVSRKVAVPPRVLADLGEVAEITYKTDKRGEKAKFFTHDFEGRRPRLGVDPRTKRLHLVGGSYTVKPAGITG